MLEHISEHVLGKHSTRKSQQMITWSKVHVYLIKVMQAGILSLDIISSYFEKGVF